MQIDQVAYLYLLVLRWMVGNVKM